MTRMRASELRKRLAIRREQPIHDEHENHEQQQMDEISADSESPSRQPEHDQHDHEQPNEIHTHLLANGYVGDVEITKIDGNAPGRSSSPPNNGND
jgi:hypothetical protein